MYHIHLIYTFFIYIITLEVQRFERLEIQGINNLPKVFSCLVVEPGLEY